QPKLLRVLQERTVRPVGSDRESPVDVRLICATNQDLELAIEERRFRADLYYRINVIPIALPALRARGTDVLLLANHFLQRFTERSREQPCELSPDAERCLMTYPWPGNVRELANCMEHAAVLARGNVVDKADLPDKVRDTRQEDTPLTTAEPAELLSLEEIERRYILRVFEAVRGNKSQAALVLGLDRKTLYRRLERYGMLRSSPESVAPASGVR
ncbi:MAG TPA: sigma 54-interacting transcriptional regulator, partial [Polyangiaceae bacterium]|nr:sigma 54-interacting transcriptional regulator [Polyangiaceae bacterium]